MLLVKPKDINIYTLRLKSNLIYSIHGGINYRDEWL